MKNFKLKIIIAGEPGSGKSFIARAADACIPVREIGASIGKISERFSDMSCEMMLITWAITRGRPKDTTHLGHSAAAIIVCDLTKPKTVERAPVWANSILRVAGDIPLFFVANNINLGTPEALNRFQEEARTYNSPWFYIQSEDLDSVKELFRVISQVLTERILNKKSAS